MIMLIMVIQKSICIKKINVKRVAGTKLDISCRDGTEKPHTIINENEWMRRARVMRKNVAGNNQRAQFSAT